MTKQVVVALIVGLLAGAFVLGLVVVAGAVGFLVWNQEPASTFVGDAAGEVQLRALDLNGDREAPIFVERLARLGVAATVLEASREGATLSLSGARDVREAAAAVMAPMRLAIYATANPTQEGGRTRLLTECSTPPCTPVLVQLPSALGAREIADAQVGGDEMGTTVINLAFTSDGALLLTALTQREIGRAVVMTLDDVVYSQPIVQERITGGRVQLTLGASDEGARAQAERISACIIGKPLTGRWEFAE